MLQEDNLTEELSSIYCIFCPSFEFERNKSIFSDNYLKIGNHIKK